MDDDSAGGPAGEAGAIAAATQPATVASLTAQLRALGPLDGSVVIAHTSLSTLGWVAGGAQAVVMAMLDALGPAGTLVMPTQSGQLSDPANWSQPPVPADWIGTLRAELPAYDPYLTPTRSMGAVVECFRQLRATVRSDHPTQSFAAHGPRADAIVRDHRFDDGFGETSPLATLYDLDAQVLLLGVGHANNTSLHLAEHRGDWHPKTYAPASAPMLVDGTRRWVTVEELEPNEDDFDQIGAALADTDIESVGPVGVGHGRLMRQRTAVDFAAAWMSEHRPASLAAPPS